MSETHEDPFERFTPKQVAAQLIRVVGRRYTPKQAMADRNWHYERTRRRLVDEGLWDKVMAAKYAGAAQ